MLLKQPMTMKLNFTGAISFPYFLRPVGIEHIEVLLLFNLPLIHNPHLMG